MTEGTNDTRTAPPFLEYLRAGLSAIPIAADGSKAPARIGGWKRYATTPPTEEQCIAWTSKFHGIAVLGGKASGGLEIIDIDSPDVVEPFVNLVRDESPDLADMLTIVRTPRRDEQGRGGCHVYYRCDAVEGNQKLAMTEPLPVFGDDDRPVLDSEGEQRKVPKTLIETRGQGGYVLAPGCAPECHPSGKQYEHVDGPPITDIQTITSEQRDILFRCARMFDRSVAEAHREPGVRENSNGERPGDVFASLTTWAEILEPHGWVQVGQIGDVTLWRRPGKINGCSATTGLRSKQSNELFCVFSSNAHPFEGPSGGKVCSTYSKFAAYALLNHDGAYQAAARALAERGFGSRGASDLEHDQRSAAPANGEAGPVYIDLDEAKTSSRVIDRLGEGIYQRAGSLVHIVKDSAPCRNVVMADGALRIRTLPAAILRERIASEVLLVRETDKGPERTRPPAWLTNAIHQRGEWPAKSIPPLVGIVRSPTIRPNFSVLQQPGYDRQTGLFYSPDGEFPLVPDSPTLGAAKAAAQVLLDVVCDFPFVRSDSEDHRSAWLAYVLTLVGRPAIDGPCPLFVFDAPTPGSGKSLLCDAAACIVYGANAPRQTWPGNDAEMRKMITAVAIEALPAVLIDNLHGDIRSASLDAVLTAVTWRDRLLGTSETTGSIPMYTVWSATGNNVQLQGDTARRVLFCRIEPATEDPESRTGFVHEDLTGWILRERHRLATAAVTILRAFAVAGRPQEKLDHWGSYEEWSSVIRQTVVWLDMPDPAATRRHARAADRSREILRLIINAIQEEHPSDALTAADLVKRAREADKYPIAHEVVSEICGAKPDTRMIGYKLRHYKERPCDGKVLISEQGHGKTNRWLVRHYSVGGDGGDGGDSSVPGDFFQTNGSASGEKYSEGVETSPPSPPSPPAQRQRGVIE